MENIPLERLSVHIDKSILSQLSDTDILNLIKDKDWDISVKGMIHADVIIATESTAMSVDLFAECSIKPIVIYQPRLSVPEFSFEQISPMHLFSVLEETRAIATKVKQLLKSVNTEYLDIFYAGLAYAWSRDKVMEPLLEPNLPKGYGYAYFDTVLGNLNPKKNTSGKDIYNFLRESGFMMSEHFEIAHTCPRCESIIVLFRDACLNCGSPHIDEEPLIHHFSCGFQSAESHYLATNESLLNEYLCPKCHKPLRHFGVDYDKPGVMYFCTNCNEANSDTKTVLKCLKCNYEGDAEDSTRLTLLSYSLTNMGKKAIFSQDLNIFNAPNFLAEHIAIVPFDVFVLLTQKLNALRTAPTCSLVSISMKQDVSHGFDETRGIYDLAKALSDHLRKSDTVTYYMGTVFVLFTETQQSKNSEEILFKKDELKKLFDDAFLENINFEMLDVGEFLHRFGEKS